MRLDVWQTLHTDLEPGVQHDGETFAAALGKSQLLLPIRTLDNGRRVASLIVNQASFVVLDMLCDVLASSLNDYRPDVIIGVPTLGLPVAEGVARRLGHSRLVPLGTSRKFWYDEALSVPLKSITTPGGGKRLYIDPRMRPLLKGRVAVIDDVLSSGSSMASVLSLLDLVNVSPSSIGAAMLQGEGWRDHVRNIPVLGAIRTPILPPKGATE
ncbi:phosphoribosyltransferase [Flavimaricola marinus]|uniref:Phosphoribosyltransferase n=1 Tax=Flavimaricola marinus TaxID=1819565 RepID=A0A238LHR3_9RHOB|nr:phosphoribosyltransferase [Flavimaricola marinus]SMY08935.1 phosphoribosyltransferase [Flavimaricola marinus]